MKLLSTSMIALLISTSTFASYLESCRFEAEVKAIPARIRIVSAIDQRFCSLGYRVRTSRCAGAS